MVIHSYRHNKISSVPTVGTIHILFYFISAPDVDLLERKVTKFTSNEPQHKFKNKDQYLYKHFSIDQSIIHNCGHPNVLT